MRALFLMGLLTAVSFGQEIKKGPSCGASPKCQSNFFDTESAPSVGGLTVYVSLSMSSEDLKKYATDVAKVGGRMVMCGLVNNSFSQTQKRFLDLGISVDIDPNAFEEKEIKVVPTFVLEEEGKWDRLSGNVSLDGALTIMADEGDLSRQATDLLKMLRRS